MKLFLTVFQEMINEKVSDNKISEETLRRMAAEYKRLSSSEQEKSIQILKDTLQDYGLIVYYMSALLKMTQDSKILFCLEKVLISDQYPLWDRMNDMSHMYAHLFLYPNLCEEKEEYRCIRNVYEHIVDEIQIKMKSVFSYIPYAERKKCVIIVLRVLLSNRHAPTKLARYIYDYYSSIGYQAECFVCYFAAEDGCWATRYVNNNFLDTTTFFNYKVNQTEIAGYNQVLHSADYIDELKKAVGLIWSKKPEFVFEIGGYTILPELCTGFTMVVSATCTKKLPATRAPLLVSFVAYSEEEQQAHRQMIGSGQRVLEVKCDISEISFQEEAELITREQFGVSDQDFVVVIAGNRLDAEVDDSFMQKIYQIVQMDEHFIIAVIGECSKLKQRMQHERILYWGDQSNFRSAVAIGDVFLNPPRQGGGTGALFAVLEEIPVITLDNCDVQINAGSDFVCAGTEEMPQLVYRYFSDRQFMEQQKINCRKRAQVLLHADSSQELHIVCEAVKEYALQKEQNFFQGKSQTEQNE